jgi:hypothetical protein
MVALAAGVLIARFHLGLLHAPVLLTPVLLRDLIRRRSPASASASSRRSSSHTSSSGVRRRRPRAAATRARLRPIRRARPRSAHRRWRLTARCPASSSPSVGWSSSQENRGGERTRTEGRHCSCPGVFGRRCRGCWRRNNAPRPVKTECGG